MKDYDIILTTIIIRNTYFMDLLNASEIEGDGTRVEE